MNWPIQSRNGSTPSPNCLVALERENWLTRVVQTIPNLLSNKHNLYFSYNIDIFAVILQYTKICMEQGSIASTNIKSKARACCLGETAAGGAVWLTHQQVQAR